MTTPRILSLAVTGALLLSGCGGHDGVELGPFPALSKTEGDVPFALTAPTSKNPAPFSYSSSDTRVASVAGNMVTVHLAGITTITAQQGQQGSYYPTSTSAVLTVGRRVCAEPTVRDDSGVCVAPPTTASFVTSGALSWMPATFGMAWAAADAFCKGVKINGTNGWRLPTQFELTTVAASGDLAGKRWTLLDTWTSTAGAAEKQHFAVNLTTSGSISFADENKAYVTCVR